MSWVIRLVTTSMLFAQGACAVAAQSANAPRESARDFVQGFYEWYLGTHPADAKVPAWWVVAGQGTHYLSTDLATALRGDSIAWAQAPITRELLGMDPFLASQDPCGPYVAVDARDSADVAVVRVESRCPANANVPSYNARASVLVKRDGRAWRVVNVRYGNSDLKSLLCQYAREDALPARRPSRC